MVPAGDLQSVHWPVGSLPVPAGYLYLGGERGWFMEVMVAVAIVSFIACWAHVLLCLGFSRNLGDILIRLSGFSSRPEAQHKYPVIGSGFTGCYCGHGSDPSMGTTVHGTIKGGLFLTL